MNQQSKVFVLLLAGVEKDAVAFAQRRYPGCGIVVLSKTALRQSGWRGQLRALRQLKGEALLLFTDARESFQEPILFKWTVLVHQCRETVLADSSGSFEVITKAGILGLLPRTFLVALADVLFLALVWTGLQLFRVWLKLGKEPEASRGELDLAFLIPSRFGMGVPGGAHTHITGFLTGLLQEGSLPVVFCGQSLETPCDLRVVRPSPRVHLFREASLLSYNIRFLLEVRKLLGKRSARLLYQRHGRFTFAGAVLSRLTGIPLVLEYNASEEWMAKHWDPSRCLPWLNLCEKISVRAASLLVVVSNILKQQLIEAGVPAARILVNPNAVDPERFHPNCGGANLRLGLGLDSRDTVVCFVGTFSYWHGIAVLGEAIRALLGKTPSSGNSLKFLLVGDGPLAPQLRAELETQTKQRRVIFAGSVPHNSVRAYLDAADILVSPHVPMPDGTPFFGSPTKLFEYMAMGKAIAASDLEQIADILEHGRTALLIKPGDAADLAKAIEVLASDARLRRELGHNARQAALSRHTWRQNARRVLARRPGPVRTEESMVPEGHTVPALQARRPLSESEICHED